MGRAFATDCCVRLILGVIGVFGASITSHAGVLPVGTARVDITPTYPIRLNGFGFRREESAGVRQPIAAKALVWGVDDSVDGPSVVIVADTLGIPDRLRQEVAKRVAPWGVRADRLVILATHTHTGPMVNHVSPTLFGTAIPPDHQAHIDRYTQEFTEALVEVTRLALADRKPSRLEFGQGEVGFAMNRRTTGGPTDHDLPLIVARDLDGKLRAIWVSYACHCVTLSDNQISGDWAGYAQAAIERLHPGCVALVSIGCGADANPSSGVVGDRADVAEMQGGEIATEVERLLKLGLTEINGQFLSQEDRISLPLAPLPDRAEWERRAQGTDAVAFHARTQLAKLDRGESLLTTIDYPIVTWSFGDQLGWVFLPGEVVVDYSLRLKRELATRRIVIHAYANHCPGYVPSERILREGGYEGGGAMIYYDLPGPYATGLEQTIVENVKRQLGARFHADATQRQKQRTMPVPPEEAVATMKTLDTLRIEQVAAEPLVQSPVAISFGTYGQLWVAEMVDYPTGVDHQYGPGGRVRWLRDHDQDGKYDVSQIFVEDIPFPTGVTPWRDGVLICAAPDILWARDTDRDGRADVVERLFTGFGTENFQGRINSLEYGLDGWVYGSCGLFGGNIQSAKGETFALGDRDFRFRPDTLEFEAASGRTQQGRVRNDAGDWFGCDNSNPLWYYPFEDHEVRGNPFYALRQPVIDGAGEAGRTYFPLASPSLFALSGPPGRATAACGLAIYRDQHIFQEYAGNAFICEPVNHLVHRFVIDLASDTCVSQRAPEEHDTEFLRSTDPWFRPVQARTGPDGALYVVDMYREVIEHPRWIPAESLRQFDVRGGADRGRIYRIRRRNEPARRVPIIAGLTPSELAVVLESPNGTLRDLAMQRLIWERIIETSDVGAFLKTRMRRIARPEPRLQILALLDVTNQLQSNDVVVALNDVDPGVRRHAARLAAQPKYMSPEVVEKLASMIDDEDRRERRQVALALAASPGVEAAQTLAKQLVSSATQPLVRDGALSGLRQENIGDVTRWVWQHAQSALDRGGDSSTSSSPLPVDDELLKELATQAFAWNSDAGIEQIVHTLGRPQISAGWRCRMLTAILRGQHLRGGQTTSSSDVATAADVAIDQWLTAAVALAHDDTAALADRVAAIECLTEVGAARADRIDSLGTLLTPQSEVALQLAAVEALQRLRPEKLVEQLVADWSQQSPVVLVRAVECILQHPGAAIALVEAMQQERVPVDILTLAQRTELLAPHSLLDESHRAMFQSLAPPSRVADPAVFQAIYRQSDLTQGDAARGREVFQKNCATCHVMHGIGKAIGPDIGPFASKEFAALVEAVLEPNRAIDPRYVNFQITLTDGRVMNGIIQQETPTSIVVANGQQEPHVILRREIEHLQRTGLSLMPMNLTEQVSPVMLVDLYRFLQSSPD